ncbi:hypothetical protein AMAG_07464 [Allomyces macrogynus ATCC 38327]|uniref:Adenylate cyclase n=1 Tax=Allomyces macrogynus (strain ATCC 38327) TaxID=578462 RepID=A0A0L0SIE8_ALLM3|nr:hypothetical protein AMAG_07464 [Allomyces macrogynus ATCC 38327]|eukprot:KNE62224.1 hypothetical protein AMAG_07464 [Allomyces macrogynus ATCC 38327]
MLDEVRAASRFGPPTRPPRPGRRPSGRSGDWPAPTPAVPAAQLVYTTSHGGRTVYQLTGSSTRIGRKDDNEIVLSCAKISKHHAVIDRDDHGYWLRDRNSSNGVKLNDVYISQAVPLTDGDKIQVGSIYLYFQYVNGPAARAAATPMTAAAPVTAPSASAATATDPATAAHQDESSLQDNMENVRLVTILPNEDKGNESVTIHDRKPAVERPDFPVVSEIHDIETLKEDYEKLRLAYELSKLSYTSNIDEHFKHMLDLMFSVLPVDRGVVLLVDRKAGMLSASQVKLRQGTGQERRHILLSNTILNKVYKSRKTYVTTDAIEDPYLGKSKSIAKGQIRSVICVPVIAHEEVLGIVHLDSRDRINTFAEKDLKLVTTIINQTALQIENSILFAKLQTETRVTEQLKRFLPPPVVKQMVQQQKAISKGGRELTATIVFADIRGFTALSEKASPAEVFDLLNDYFERLVQIVFKYNGVVDKFIGDALMCAFGTLVDDVHADPRPAVLNSVHAALEFKTAIDALNRDRQRAGKVPIAVGIGLNTGTLISGFMGSSQRLEFTCIGDTVNLASRLCSAAAPDQVLISGETAAYIKGKIDLRYVESRQFKGKEQATNVYEVLGVLGDGMMDQVSELSQQTNSSANSGVAAAAAAATATVPA